MMRIKCFWLELNGCIGHYMFIGFSLHDKDRKVFSISAAMHIRCVIDAFIINVLPQ